MMDISRSRRLERHRSPYTSRSRSRSFGSRKGRRSSSRERYRSNASPGYNGRKTSLGDRIRVRSPPSPIRRPSPVTFNRIDSLTNPEKRLKKPEIYSIIDNDSTRVATSSSPANAQSITLNERFTRLTRSGTALYNKRFPGRSWDLRQVPHLIISNNMQLPPATLFRQAKTISVVVERKFPPGRKRPSAADDYTIADVTIPRRANEGIRPVFDRPEIKFYQTAAEESEIVKRLLECISSSSTPSSSTQPTEHRGRSKDTRSYVDQPIVGVGRFYGSRVDESFVNSRSAHPLDPLETPRNPSYFMHDTRDDTELTSRRNWRTRFPNSSAGYRRDFRDRSPGSPVRPHRNDDDDSPVGEVDKWKHDKFEQLESGDPLPTTTNAVRSVPVRPVPPPKPSLWSTIGKEVVNGEEKRGSRSSPLLDQSADEDVRIDVEPVLADSVDEN